MPQNVKGKGKEKEKGRQTRHQKNNPRIESTPFQHIHTYVRLKRKHRKSREPRTKPILDPFTDLRDSSSVVDSRNGTSQAQLVHIFDELCSYSFVACIIQTLDFTRSNIENGYTNDLQTSGGRHHK